MPMRRVLLLLLLPLAWCNFVGDAADQELVERFNSWIDSNGGDFWSKIRVGVIPGFRLGAVAKTTIQEDDVYLEVPWRMVISEDSIRQSEVGDAFLGMRSRHGLDVGDSLLLYLLHERFSSGSFWGPYIDILPRAYEIPFYWTQGDLEELEGTGMPEAVSIYLETHRHSFERFSRIVTSEPTLERVAQVWDWDLFMWASSVLDSRTIWINGRKRCFLPMLDMVNNQNHISRVHHTSLDEADQVTQTKAIWKFEAGEQLFENYGSENSHNLLYHGFVLEQNSYDSAKFGLGASSDEPTQALLNALGVPKEHTIRAQQKFGPPVSLMADARIRALEPDQIQSGLRGELRRNYGAKISGPNEQRAVQILSERCEHYRTKQYKTSGVELDEEMLRGDGLSANVRLAVRFRLQQKRIVAQMCEQLPSSRPERDL